MTEQWQELKETITEMRDNDGTGSQQEVCKFLVDYMEVLEKQMQEPCEDCISRAKALDTLKTSFLGMSFERYKKAKRMFEQLPSVTPKYTDEEIDKAQAVEQAYVDKMVELAVEETKRPKGKWLHIYKSDIACKCSVCHIQMPITEYYHYCPNCGAEMSGGGEDG